MKKEIFRMFTFITVAGALFLFSCEKGPQSLDEWGDPDNPPEEQPEIRGESLKLNAAITPFVVDSRVTLDDAFLSWDEDEQFGLFERVGIRNTNSNVAFSLLSGEGSATGEFEGFANLENPWNKNDRTLYYYYPYSSSSRDYEGVTFSLPQSQEQDPLSPEDHLSQTMGMVGKLALSSSQSNSNLSLEFTPIYSILEINVENNSEDPFDLSGVVLRNSSGEKIFPIRATYNLETEEYTPTSTGKVGHVAIAVNEDNPITLAPGENYTLSLMLFPIELAASTTLTYEVYTSIAPVEKEIELTETISYNANTIHTTQVVIEEEDLAYAKSTLPSGTNCYMVEPPAVEGEMLNYNFPITRVNEFWSITDYDGTNFSNPDNIIRADTKWVADIIWKDVDVDGGQELITLTNSTGVGPEEMISFQVNYDAAERYGNAIIGIRKADENFEPVGEEYLWSWHIWVSDYPSNGSAHDVSGGRDIYTMDRNLGAKNATPGEATSMGLMYQWGRKDPFPTVTYGYWDIDGSANVFQATTLEAPDWNDRNILGDAECGNVPYAVQHPASYILAIPFTEGGYDDWQYEIVGTASISSTLWLDTDKTIFDPCPKGFKVASRYAFSSFAAANNPVVDYFPSSSKKRGVILNNTVWFPYNGQISRSTGKPASFQSGAYLQTSASYTGSSGPMYRRCFAYNNEGLTGTDYGFQRGTALAVRCMVWEADD